LHPTFIIHDAIQARTVAEVATELGIHVHVETPFDMANALGPLWAKQFMDMHPEYSCNFIYNCGVSIGAAQAAIHLKLPFIRLTTEDNINNSALQALKDIAKQSECKIFLGPIDGPVKRLPPPCGPCETEQLKIVIKEWLVSIAD